MANAPKIGASIRTGASMLALAIIYFAAGKFGLSLAFLNASASPVWPPTGIALAVLLLFGHRLWPAVLVGAFFVNLTTPDIVGLSLGPAIAKSFFIALGNTIEAIVGAGLVKRYAKGIRAFERAQTIFRFLVLAAGASTFISAVCGVTTLCISGAARWEQFWAVGLTWWLGDMVSDLIVAPLLVVWVRKTPPRAQGKSLMEAAALATIIVAVGSLVFLVGSRSVPNTHHFGYLAIPPLLWAAFRFGERGAATFAFVMSGFAVWGTLHQLGPFTSPEPNQALLYTQSFMGTIAVTTLVLAALISERQRAEQRFHVQEAVSRALAESDTIMQAAPKIFAALFQVAGWEAGTLWQVDRSANEISCDGLWHIPGLEISDFETVSRKSRFAAGTGLPGRVWSSGQPIWFRNVIVEQNFPRAAAAAKNRLRGALCFPIKLGEEVLGVIECFSRSFGEPDEDFLQMCAGVGRQLGQFIERKNAEEAVRRSERELSDFFENASQGLHWVDANGIIVRANRAELELLGYAPGEYIGHHIAEFHVEREVIDDMLKRLAGGELLDDYPSRMRCKDGSIKDVLINSSVYSEGGRFIHTRCFTQDVTELEQARKQLKAQAEDLEKMVAERTARLREVVGELEAFSYSISHDMRAPLRAMQGYSKYLLDEFGEKLGSQAADFLNRISNSAMRLDRLIQDVLTYSRVVRSDLHLVPVDLDRLTRDTIESYPEWQKPRAEIRVEGKLPVVMGNEAFLTQCITNLVGNAVKFVRNGEIPRVKISATTSEDCARICFEDNGIGIAAKDQQRIFGMFERLHSDGLYEGTGIGLAIVRKAVDRMGGQLSVESELGKGSKFFVQLRRADAARIRQSTSRV